MTHRSDVPLHHTVFKAAARTATLAALLALATTLQAQITYDNFDTGSLNPASGWALFNNPTYPTSYTFVPDAFGGSAFRMQGFVPANAGSENGTTTARAAAVCTNNVYTDFYVAADLLNWQTNWFENTNYTFLGLAARVDATTDGIASGTNWSGVALFNWLNANSDGNGPGSAAIGLGWIINGTVYFNLPMVGVNTDGGVAPAAAVEWTLEPGHNYRLTFQGVGATLTGQVFDTQDLTKPLGTINGDTSLGGFAYPAPGIYPFLAAPTSGWSGMFAIRYSDRGNGDIGYDTNGVTDATFDNFYAGVTPPTSVSAPAIPHGMIGAPQVINRTPASWANFYSPASGIVFDATTLTTTNAISSIRLILNGVDVTSSLTITGNTPNTNMHVTFGLAGSSYSLAPNTVYDANIILQDSYNRKTTNFWTFDTFSDAYLAQYPNIECEDYDYLGGSWNPFPVVASGFSTNDNTWYTPAGSIIGPLGYTFGINGGLNSSLPAGQFGYAGMSGVNANGGSGTPDYYECARTYPLPGAPLSLLSLASGFNFSKLLPACEYRTGAQNWPDNGNAAKTGDAVGTEEGAGVSISVWNITTNANGYLYANYAYDTKRQKYAALNAAGLAQAGGLPGSYYSVTGSSSASWWDVEEYNVMGTEGSDWFNYTKDWGTATNYNVYLRNACALTEHLYLYNGATTNRANQLGTFYCTNALMWNWRYTPLLDANGKPVVVNLSGTTTLRLEIQPESPKYAAVERGLALNYLAFVPTNRPQLVTNIVLSTTNRIISVVKGAGNFTVNALGTPGATYYLVTSGNIKTAMASWTPVAGSTNTASTPNGTWSATVSAAAPAYYRAVAVNPHP